MDATAAKFTSIGTLIGVPFNGSSLAKPLTTDLTASQLVQLGWVKFRASSSSSVHCRLGGDLGGGGGGSPSEDNPATIAMFLGKSAPQPPTGPFDPGCVDRPPAAVASAPRPLASARASPKAGRSLAVGSTRPSGLRMRARRSQRITAVGRPA